MFPDQVSVARSGFCWCCTLSEHWQGLSWGYWGQSETLSTIGWCAISQEVLLQCRKMLYISYLIIHQHIPKHDVIIQEDLERRLDYYSLIGPWGKWLVNKHVMLCCLFWIILWNIDIGLCEGWEDQQYPVHSVLFEYDFLIIKISSKQYTLYINVGPQDMSITGNINMKTTAKYPK